MEHRIHPTTAQKIDAINGRRKSLLAKRGLLAIFTVLFGVMSLAALVDAFVLLEDSQRWGISLGIYAGLAVVLWMIWIVRLLFPPNRRDLARLIESHQPNFRESLLSAIELGEEAEETNNDSATFRKALQASVAKKVSKLEARTMLPGSVLRGWVWAGGAAAIVFVLLFVSMGTRFQRSFVRVAFPPANVARISNVQVEIEEPRPEDRLVPAGDPVAVTVLVDSEDVSRAYLETFAKGADTEEALMQPLGGGRFQTHITPRPGEMRFRVKAGDAVTEKRELIAKERPKVVAFEKHYRYPAYARFAPKRVNEENGHLEGLMGTKVDIVVETDQPVEKGVLLAEKGGNQFRLNLQPVEDATGLKHAATVPLTASGTYKLTVFSSETGFDNRYGPQYEMVAVSDLKPSITLVQPENDLILDRHAKVEVSGKAEDDVSLAQLALMTRLNGGEWEEAQSQEIEGRQTNLAWRSTFSLGDLVLQTGDKIKLKLTATDLNGTEAESRAVEITVAPDAFTQMGFEDLGAEIAVEDALAQATEKGHELAERLNNIRQQARGDDADPLELKRELMEAQQAAEALRDAADLAVDRAKEALPKAIYRAEAENLANVGKAMRQLEKRIERKMAPLIAEARQIEDREAALEQIEQLAEQGQQAHGQTRELAKQFARTLLPKKAEAVAEALAAVKGEQRELKELAAKGEADAEARERFMNRQQAAAEMGGKANAMLEEIAADAGGQPRAEAERDRRQIAKELAKLQEKLAEEDPQPRAMEEPAERLADAAEGARRNLAENAPGLGKDAAEAKRRLEDLAKPATRQLEELKNHTQQENRLDDRLTQNADDENARLQLEEHSEQVNEKVEDTIKALRAEAEMLELARNADFEFVADAAKAADALEEIQTEFEVERDIEKRMEGVARLDEAFRELEAAHQLTNARRQATETAQRADELAAQQQSADEQAQAQARAARQQQLAELQDELAQLPNEAKRANVPEATRKALNALRGSEAAKDIDQAVRDREPQEERLAAAEERLPELEAELANAEAALQPELAKARNALDQMAPGIEEKLARAAENARQQREQTTQLAQEFGEETDRDLAEWQGNQEALQEEMENVRNTLRREANAQDLLDRKARERAQSADFALAELEQPVQRMREAEQRAAMAADTHEETSALRAAEANLDELAQKLQNFADHFDQFDPEAAREERERMALAQREEGEALQEEYTAAENMAEAMQEAPLSPAEALARLEKQLAENPEMREALSELSREAALQAASELAQARDREAALAQDAAERARRQREENPEQNAEEDPAEPETPRTEESAEDAAGQEDPPGEDGEPQARNEANARQQAEVEEQVARSEAALGRAARHEQRLDQEKRAQALEQVGERLAERRENELAQVREALEQQSEEASAAALERAEQALASDLEALGEAVPDLPLEGNNRGEPNANAEQGTPETSEHPEEPQQAGHEADQNSPARVGEAPNQQGERLQQAQQDQDSQQANQGENPQQGQAAQNPQSQRPQRNPQPGQSQEQNQQGQQGEQQARQETGRQLAQALDQLDDLVNSRARQQTGRNQPQQPNLARQEQAANEGSQPAANAGKQQGQQQANTSAGQQGNSQQQNAQGQSGQNAQPPAGEAQVNQGQPQNGEQQQAQGQQGQGPQGASADQQALQQAMDSIRAASQAQAQSMAQARNQGRVPGRTRQSDPQGGQQAQASGQPAQQQSQGSNPSNQPGGGNIDLAEARVVIVKAELQGEREWGKLPSKTAKELTEGSRSGVSEEYRAAVEAYYRAIADEARK